MKLTKIQNLINNKLIEIDNQLNTVMSYSDRLNDVRSKNLKVLYEYRAELLNERQVLIDIGLIEKTN